ncbi:MAG TPA: hypothetical protein VMU66_03540 [Gaiellales bacterium]|nr:hypothetical protein [Gaiellales bacterium]
MTLGQEPGGRGRSGHIWLGDPRESARRTRLIAGGLAASTIDRQIFACPSGERHDIGLIAFGLALREQGWRIVWLGADTPLPTIAEAAADLHPAAVVLGLTARTRADRPGDDRLAVGGPGATPAVAARLGAELLARDLVGAASQLSAGTAGGWS